VRAAAQRARIRNEVERLIHEPLPLVYERIASQYPNAERRARADLAKFMRDLKHNEIHVGLMALPFPTILTTNYDMCLEAASAERFVHANLESETTYSLFRRKRSRSCTLWHIHGELSGPRTMMLGFHQYAGYLQKLRRYLTTRAEGSPVVFGNPVAAESTEHSWADLFLRDDVHMVGLGFDYGETDLWWLLSYKQRLRVRKKIRVGTTTFYHMGQITQSVKGRLELMMGFGVRVKHLPSASASGKPDMDTWRAALGMLRSVR
jgi:hypothetical protein